MVSARPSAARNTCSFAFDAPRASCSASSGRRLDRQVHGIGMVEDLVGELRARQLDAAFLPSMRRASRKFLSARRARAAPAGEGRPLLGHRLEDAAGVAPAIASRSSFMSSRPLS